MTAPRREPGQQPGQQRGQQPGLSKVPGLVQGAVVVVVLVVVAAVALTARQPSPPSVAEYAPEAVAQIKQAPAEQSVDLGHANGGSTTTTADAGAGQGGRNGGAGSTTSTTQVIDVPRVRRCVGDPPRQIEDPQSPPCVAYFDPKQDNGGATYRGVTRSQITILYTPDFLEDVNDVHTLFDFFAKRFEFYGRTFSRDEHPAAQSNGTTDPDPTLMQADAQSAYDTQDFASLNYAARQGAEFTFYDSLADKGIISVSHRLQAEATDAHFRKYAPYEWSAMPTVDSVERNIGQFICGSLAGKAPKYAGGTQAQAPTRVFGLVIEAATDSTAPDPTPLRDELRKCNADVVVTEYDRINDDTARTGQNEMLGMANQHVTSVICLCDAIEARQTLMPSASAQAFMPEWLLSSYLDNDLDNSMSQAPPDQAAHVLGLVFRNKLLPQQDMPFYWALKEMNPSANPTGGNYYSLFARYMSLLVLSSGIQLAGPHLTPSTFAAGLIRARWANPGAGGPRYYQAAAGFDGGRHTFIDDAAMYWYSPSQPGTVDPTAAGAVCYVDHGTRHGLGDWPSSDPAFFDRNNCL
jgi:hypothetical protein